MPTLQTTQAASTGAYSQNTFAADTVWRDGKFIVIRKGASLPERCLQTNAAVSGSRKNATFYWYPPLLLLLLLLNWVIFLIVVMATRKKVVVEIVISPEMVRRRNRLCLIGAVITLSGMIEFLLGMLKNSGDALQIFIGLVAFFAGLIVVARGSQIVIVHRIEGDYIWLKGASPVYLSGLSEWRGMPPG